MPEVFDRFFQAIGFRREDFYGLRKLDPSFEVVTDSARIKVKPDAGGRTGQPLTRLRRVVTPSSCVTLGNARRSTGRLCPPYFTGLTAG